MDVHCTKITNDIGGRAKPKTLEEFKAIGRRVLSPEPLRICLHAKKQTQETLFNASFGMSYTSFTVETMIFGQENLYDTDNVWKIEALRVEKVESSWWASN